MYKSFFGLQRAPFSVAADPRFIYMSPEHSQAAQHLLLGMQSGAGFILLTGEIGSGKSVVCRAFLRMLPPNVDVANVVNPRVDFRGLLLRICEELRITVSSNTTDLIDAIHGHLLLARAEGRRTLIIVDEAQALSHEVLELLRLLTNLDSTGRHLQIFLIGQPELRVTLRLPALAPVSQRIVARFHLQPLPETETPQYIAHRLRVAGLEGPNPFNDKAVEAIHRWSRGLPRRINVLCDRAMLSAQQLDTREIGSDLIERIAPEVFDELPPTRTARIDFEVFDELPPTRAAVAKVFVPEIEPPEIEPPEPQSSVAEIFSRALPETVVPEKPVIAAPPVRRNWANVFGLASIMVVLGAVLGAVLLDLLHASMRPSLSSAPVVAAPAKPAPAPPPTPVTASTGTPPVVSSNLPIPAAPPTAAQPMPSPQSQSQSLETVALDEPTALRDLARLWNVASLAMPAGRTCESVAKDGLRCYRTTGGLDKIRLLDRPGIMSVKSADGRTRFVLLVGLTDHSVLLRSGAKDVNLPISELAGRWPGDFTTLVRAPPQSSTSVADGGDSDMSEWLRDRLHVLDGNAPSASSADALNARLVAFQIANGLQPDGVAGPLTLMKLNHATGLTEPKLETVH